MRVRRPLLQAACVLASLAASCERPGAELEALERARARASSAECLLIAPEGLELRRLEHLAAALERRTGGAARFAPLRPPHTPPREQWIADPRSSGIGRFAQLNGIVFEPGGGAFWFGGERFAERGDGLRLCAPDPDQPAKLIELFLAPTADGAAELVHRLDPPEQAGWTHVRGGLVVADSLRPGLVRTAEPTPVDGSGMRWRVAADAPPAAVAEYRAAWDAARLWAEQRLVGLVSGPASHEVWLWSDLDAFANATGACELSVSGLAVAQSHVLLAGDGLDDGAAQLASAWACAFRGVPLEEWAASALGTLAAQKWCGAPLDVALELAADASQDLDAVLRPPARASQHRFGPLRALALELALEGLEPAAAQRLWREGGLEARIAPARFAQEVERLAALGAARRAARRVECVSRLGDARGVHLHAPADRAGERGLGYGSRACFEALRKLAAAGANCVVFEPRAYESGGVDGALLHAPREPFATSASDAALLLAMRQARGLGLSVVLAPQLWASPSGPSATARQHFDAAQWSSALENLEAALTHYGLLAELGGAQVLCVAERSLGAARAELPEPSSSSWARVVRAARASFGGALTYLAQFDGESHLYPGWDELDLVSVALVRDISAPQLEGRAPDDRELAALLRSEIRAVMRWAQALGRPVWLAHLGFAPTTHNWLDPRVAQGGYDTQQQARMFSALRSAWEAARADGGAPQGLLVWNWSTDAEHGNALDRSFTLQNRPAQELLEALLRRP